MGRLKGNQIHAVGLSAVSPISGSVSCDSCTWVGHEKVRRNRRSRKVNSPADETTDRLQTSQQHYNQSEASRRPGPSSRGRTSSNSPSNSGSQSPGRLGAYAGAKFGDAPSPRLLPLPPKHWLCCSNLQSLTLSPCHNMTSEIKTLLQVA